MFLIIKTGVYQHGVHGIYEHKEEAILNCQTQANRDRDDYHYWSVHEVPVGVLYDNADGEGFTDHYSKSNIFSTGKKN